MLEYHSENMKEEKSHCSSIVEAVADYSRDIDSRSHLKPV